MYQSGESHFTILLFAIVGLSCLIITNSYTSNDLDIEIPTDFEEGVYSKSIFPSLFNTNTNDGHKVEANFRYTIGKRVKNDRLISQHTDKSYWPLAQNVTLILTYPASGQGAIVTYVDVIVNQSSKIGVARVIAGGIGKRYIATIVEANQTYWFNYHASIYGIW